MEEDPVIPVYTRFSTKGNSRPAQAIENQLDFNIIFPTTDTFARLAQLHRNGIFINMTDARSPVSMSAPFASVIAAVMAQMQADGFGGASPDSVTYGGMEAIARWATSLGCPPDVFMSAGTRIYRPLSDSLAPAFVRTVKLLSAKGALPCPRQTGEYMDVALSSIRSICHTMHWPAPPFSEVVDALSGAGVMAGMDKHTKIRVARSYWEEQ